MNLDDEARRVIDAAKLEEWLTVKEFAVRVGMRESSVREAIRKQRLTYRVERLTTGPRGAIRIIIPRSAA